MGSRTSKAKRPPKAKHPTAKTTAAVVPRIPQDIIDEIVDQLTAGSRPSIRSPALESQLRSCALVSKSWVPPCRRYLFHTVYFTVNGMARWLETFPVPGESPAHHVRDLSLALGEHDGTREKFFEYLPWFTNAETMSLYGYGSPEPLWMPSVWRLPQSITSLGTRARTVTLVHLQAIMVQLPNLNEMSLSGPLAAVDEGELVGIGTTLRGRYSGKLELYQLDAGGVVDMLLEVPTGVHFSHLQIRGTHECFLPTVKLAEACGESLVKLSYIADSYDGCGASGRSLDFSKLPNLREARFAVRWAAGGVPWIPAALSTVRPATSPCILEIRLQFVPDTDNVEAAIDDMGNDLRRVADQVSRIKREFKGTVKLIVDLYPAFKALKNTINIP